jgi:hypothetical protein
MAKDVSTSIYQQMLFSALAKRGLKAQGGTAYYRASAEDRRQEPHANDHQSGRGCTADWFSGAPTQQGRPPRRTGASALQWYRRELQPTQCSQRIRAHAANPSLDHKLAAGLETRPCSRKAPAGWTKCQQHGLGKRSKGVLVTLLPEEVPVLLCDR